jgi:hypothetical protein
MLRNIPQIVYDINQPWGSDIVVSAAGDLDIVSGMDRSNQRILRRLLTTAPNYIWAAKFGAGLPGYIGQPLSQDLFQQYKSTILSQIFLEASVAQVPQPVILTQNISGGIFTQINYTDQPTQQPIVLTFNLGVQ